MKQVTKKGKTVKKKVVAKKQRKHPLFGTSKLEEDFARDFLDKLGVKYIYQYFAREIGRYYDFAILLDESSGVTPGSIILIEIDGSFFHSDPRVVDENNLSPMQKRNRRVDEHKNKWALSHSIPLVRIWEKDIRETPDKVMKDLKKRLYIQDEKQTIAERKNKRHINKIK
jgi:hypothetical protein